MFEINPLHARFWFKRRELITLICSAAVFGILFFIFAFVKIWLGVVIGVLGLIAFKFLWADLQVFGIRCKCGEVIDTTTPWVCGYKINGIEHNNNNTIENPFINECGYEQCRKIQKAYICHHCKEVLFLSTDRDGENPARRLGDIIIPVDPRDVKITGQKEKIEDLKHKYEVTKLEKQIKMEKLPPQQDENKSEELLIQEDMFEIEKIVSVETSVDQAIERKIAQNAVRYPDKAQRERMDERVRKAGHKVKLKRLMEGK